MPNHEHSKKHLYSFGKGIDTDTDKEILGAKDNGEYIAAKNMRPTANDGTSQGLTKIGGETIFYDSQYPNNSYQCLLSCTVREHIVEFWASTSPASELPLIRIDGQVMARSSGLTFTAGIPFQNAINNNCLGGEIFPTDKVHLPLFFDIQNIIDNFNAGSKKYFDNFDITLYQVKLFTSIDTPLFGGLVNSGTGGAGQGVPPGMYSYSMRYVTKSGDATQYSPETPYVPVLNTMGSAEISPQFPYYKAAGANSANVTSTGFAVKLFLRVFNAENYDHIEIRRVAANKMSALDFIEQAYTVGTIPISPGEIDTITFIDDGSVTPIAIPDSVDTDVPSSFQTAKTVRYYNNRLVYSNIGYASRDVGTVKFLKSANGNIGFPAIQSLKKAGHKDPYNHTYYRSLPSGEVSGWGLLLRDNTGTRSFVVPIEDPSDPSSSLKSYQTPNRRVPLSSDTIQYSSSAAQGGVGGGSSAIVASVDNGRKLTHEVFDLDNGVSQSDQSTKYTMNGDDGYSPVTPTSPVDDRFSGHNYLVNNVYDSAYFGSSGPAIFAPNYYAIGMFFQGIDISTLPDWVTSVSIVKTKPAGRVIAQGIGMYDMKPARVNEETGFASAGISKIPDSFWFYSPDVENGIVPSNLLDNLGNGNYKAQFVAPLGYLSQVWNFDTTPIRFATRSIDMIVYARLLNGAGREISNLDQPIQYGQFNNDDGPDGFFGTGTYDGEKASAIESFSIITDVINNRRFNPVYRLKVQNDIYKNPNTGTVGHSSDSQGRGRIFTEPFYIINIIAEGAKVPDNNIVDYLDIGHHLKLTSVVGISNGQAGTYTLVNERWEDCIPNVNNPSVANENRYVFIKDPVTLKYFRWINTTYFSTGKTNGILADIAVNGFYTDSDANKCYGIYQSVDINGDQRYFNLSFSIFNGSFPTPIQIPVDASQIQVNYDARIPIKVFGGDRVVSENIFSPIDGASSPDGGPETAGSQFQLYAPFPHRKFVTPGDYDIAVDVSNGVTAPLHRLQPNKDGYIDVIRQMAVMFCCESRCASNYAYYDKNLLTQEAYFPQMAYVMRPLLWDPDSQDNNFTDGPSNLTVHGAVSPQYKIDYPKEFDIWKYGGFRVRQVANTNIDYAKTINDQVYTAKPKSGFVEKLDFCSRTIWSDKRKINQQNSPGLKTFPALNTFDASDGQGDINYLYDASTDKGSNLYAIADTGICLFITEKTTLRDSNGNTVGQMSSDSFINNELWLTRSIGCPDEMWRAIAESFSPISTEQGQLRSDALFFPNKDSVFMLKDNIVLDVGRKKYFSKLNKYILPSIKDGFNTKMAGFYDTGNQEYWIVFDDAGGIGQKSIVLSDKNKMWLDEYDYVFDRMTSLHNKSFGMKGLKTYELNKGLQINGQNIEGSVTFAVSPDQYLGKEFVRQRINSSAKPSSIEFFTLPDYENNTVSCSLVGSSLKDYNGYEQFIPRFDAVPRNRFQGRLMIVKIIHNLAESFTVVNSSTDYKILK